MKYLTKENILLALVGFVVFVQAQSFWGAGDGPRKPRAAAYERMRGESPMKAKWLRAKKGGKQECCVAKKQECCVAKKESTES